MEYCKEEEVWDRLIIAILDRALLDVAGKCIKIKGQTALQEANFKRDAKRFINSETCELMCSCISMDVKLIRENLKLVEKNGYEGAFSKRRRG